MTSLEGPSAEERGGGSTAKHLLGAGGLGARRSTTAFFFSHASSGSSEAVARKKIDGPQSAVAMRHEPVRSVISNQRLPDPAPVEEAGRKVCPELRQDYGPQPFGKEINRCCAHRARGPVHTLCSGANQWYPALVPLTASPPLGRLAGSTRNVHGNGRRVGWRKNRMLRGPKSW